MTICLAALCRQEDEPVAVVAADRMVTMGGFIEFEHPVPKMAQQREGLPWQSQRLVTTMAPDQGRRREARVAVEAP